MYIIVDNDGCQNVFVDISTIIFDDDIRNYHCRYVKTVIFNGYVRSIIVSGDMFEIIVVNDDISV